ncbi:polysaccharide pyruvyl transferase family protein [Flavicella marina]|uniref:polysaccharide pyruvyl transferase family protein n=1 Tax=Flavicella marina TaxID=1475951 RepID=UPI0012643E9A|nr:polysaccharide pyruvyl transferase family protein [Flavicella marina]
MRYIQVDNAGFVNKGAELMLRSIIKHYDANEEVRIVYNGGGDLNEYVKIQKVLLNLYSPLSLQRFKIKFSNFIDSQKILMHGLVFDKDISVVLDAGGFQFGDQWIYETTKIEKINKRIKYYKDLKKRGVKIVFLPQAFGSFEKKLSKYYILKLYAICDLFFARDKVSFEYMSNILSSSEKLQLAPDFTNLYLPEIDDKSKFELYKNKICVIPNSKMLTHTTKEIASNYKSFLIKIVKELKRQGEEVFFLNHEGQSDLDLIKELNHLELPFLTDLNANEVKFIIGQSKMLISSRFHGVVSGLSQSIPTFSTSWSHKYNELMSDYGFFDGLLNVNKPDVSINKISKYLHPSEYKKLKNQLDLKGKEEKKKSKEMWSMVDNFVL